jgi:hypothetical protein
MARATDFRFAASCAGRDGRAAARLGFAMADFFFLAGMTVDAFDAGRSSASLWRCRGKCGHLAL